MSTFMQLTSILCGITGMLFSTQFLFSIYLMVRMKQQKRWKALGITCFLSLLLYLSAQCLGRYILSLRPDQPPLPHGSLALRFMELPAVAVIGILLMALGLEIHFFIITRRHFLSSLSSHSIKEAMDSLPSGILCSYPGGRIILINKTMEQFFLRICKAQPINADDLLDALRTGTLSDGCVLHRLENQTIVVLDEDQAFSVSMETIEYEQNPLNITVITDVTQEYMRAKELEEQSRQLSLINESLLKKNQEIISMIAENEVLHAKMKIHNELGALLISIRKYISEEPDSFKEASLLEELRQNILFLKPDHDSDLVDECDLMLKTAGELGVHVVVNGVLPTEETHRHILASAIHECFTNTLRHAHGDLVCIDIEDRDVDYLITFKNNGIQPAEDITEKGGLISLRMLTESAGGTMKVISLPELTLTLQLRKEDLYV